MATWLWWALDGINPYSWYKYFAYPTYPPLALDNVPRGLTLEASDVLTLEMAITAEFQEKLQQLNIGGGKERQTRIECTVKVLHGNLAQLQLVRDSPHNPEKLIALDETPTGEVCTLCLDRVNSSMFEPCAWYVTLIAGTSGCKVTVNSRIVTVHTTVAADKQKHTTEHVHSPRLLMYGLDAQHASNMAAVQRSEASESEVAEDVYRQMDDKAATQV